MYKNVMQTYLIKDKINIYLFMYLLGTQNIDKLQLKTCTELIRSAAKQQRILIDWRALTAFWEWPRL